MIERRKKIWKWFESNGEREAERVGMKREKGVEDSPCRPCPYPFPPFLPYPSLSDSSYPFLPYPFRPSPFHPYPYHPFPDNQLLSRKT